MTHAERIMEMRKRHTHDGVFGRYCGLELRWYRRAWAKKIKADAREVSGRTPKPAQSLKRAPKEPRPGNTYRGGKDRATDMLRRRLDQARRADAAAARARYERGNGREPLVRYDGEFGLWKPGKGFVRIRLAG